MPTETITKSFLSQGAVIIAIVVSSIVGFNYIGDRNEAAIDKAFETKCKPLYDDIIVLKAFAKDNRTLINENTADINNTMLSVNIFIDAYNRCFNKEFLRPVDVQEQNYKRKNK